MTFAGRELEHQLGVRASGFYERSGQIPGPHGQRTFPSRSWCDNLFDPIRDETKAYFEKPSHEAEGAITWHRMRGHLLSSQVACLNFLMPFATRPDALAALLSRLYPGRTLKALPIRGEGRPGENRYVAFEWVGRGNYLGETAVGGIPTRGANCTSTDAMVLLEVDGRREMLLIEWKYTEAYRPSTTAWQKGNETRRARYAHLAFAPSGPIRPDASIAFDDLLHEPFYQLMRQQVLARQLELHPAHEERAECVRVLHIAPSANIELCRVTSPALRDRGDNAFGIWQSLLAEPDRFLKSTTANLFSDFSTGEFGLDGWREYIARRYFGALKE